MRFIYFVFLFYCLCMVMVACSSSPNLAEPSATIPPTINPETTQTSQTPELTTLSLGAYMLKRLPKCDRIQVLDTPVKFDWPNIDERLQELADAQWGYYSCPGSQKDIAAFYRQQMPKPPINMYETNWVERAEGSVGVYYNGVSWIYLWVVPQPDNLNSSFVIVAQSYNPVSGNCWLELPQIKIGFFTGSDQWVPG